MPKITSGSRAFDTENIVLGGGLTARRAADGRVILDTTSTGAGDGGVSTTVGQLAGGSAGRFIRDTGSVGAWSTTTIPDTFASGTIPYASSANTLAALAAPGATAVLQHDGSAPSWVTTLPALNGSALTNLTATNLASGTVPDARLSANVVVLSGTQTISGVKTFLTGGATDTYAQIGNNGLEQFRHATNANGPVIQQSKSRGTSGTPTAVTTNDILGGMLFRGYDGSAYAAWAGMRAKADGVPSTSSHPSRIALEATDAGSTTLREVLIGYGNGHFGFATVNATPAAPPAGYAYFYATSAGQIRARTSTGDHYIIG